MEEHVSTYSDKLQIDGGAHYQMSCEPGDWEKIFAKKGGSRKDQKVVKKERESWESPLQKRKSRGARGGSDRKGKLKFSRGEVGCFAKNSSFTQDGAYHAVRGMDQQGRGQKKKKKEKTRQKTESVKKRGKQG